MISEREFDKDAAMLASMVGGHLRHVDSITSDRSQPANKIDIDNFIAPLRGGPPPQANPYDPANKGYLPEAVVQNMAPDISVSLVDKNIQTLPVITPSVAHKTAPVQSMAIVEKDALSELESDIKTIKSTLLKIDTTFSKISGMLGKVFNHITEKEKLNKLKD
jgi:hypothetical protein